MLQDLGIGIDKLSKQTGKIDLMELNTNCSRSGVFEELAMGGSSGKMTRFGTRSFSKEDLEKKSKKNFNFHRENRILEESFSPKNKIGQRNQDKQQIRPKDRFFGTGLSWKKQSFKETETKPQNHREKPDPDLGFSPNGEIDEHSSNRHDF